MTYIEEAKLIERSDDINEVVLDNIPMKVISGVGYELLNIADRREQQGDTGAGDDHPLNTTRAQRTWVAGQLVRDGQPGQTGKYWNAHAYINQRGALTHALKVNTVPLPTDVPAGQVVPHDRLGDNFYLTAGNFDGRILELGSLGQPLRNPGALVTEQIAPGTVTGQGVTFRVRDAPSDTSVAALYIPTTNGYVRLNEDFSVDLAPDPADNAATVAICLHQDKLFRLLETGQIVFAIDHTDDWQWCGTIPDGSEPRNIFQDFDDDGNRVIGVTTSSGEFLLDFDNQVLFETDFKYPDHPQQGYGAASWRAGTYVSVGVGIHRKVSGLIDTAGLDEGDGLPDPFAGGFIVDLEPSYNYLFCAVAGSLQGAPDSPIIEEEAFGLTSGLPYPIVGKGSKAQFLGINRMGAIFGWNGLGWAEFATWHRPPTRVVVSMLRSPALNDRYQYVMWGDVDGGFYAVRLPGSYYNPLLSPNLPLDRESFLEGSRWDWGTKDVPKIAKQFNVKPAHLWHKLTPDQENPYLNRIHVICNWVDLDGLEHHSDDPDVLAGPGPYPWCSVTPDGRGVAPAPYLDLAAAVETDNVRRSASIGFSPYRNTGILLPTGLPHESIWMTYRFLGDTRGLLGDERDDLTGGVIQWDSIICRKWQRPQRVWTLQIDCQDAYKGVSATDLQKSLDAMCLKKGGVPMVLGDELRIVDVTSLDGNQEGGMSPAGFRTVTCSEFTDITYERVELG